MKALFRLSAGLMTLACLFKQVFSDVEVTSTVVTSTETAYYYESTPFCPPRFSNQSYTLFKPISYTSYMDTYPGINTYTLPAPAAAAGYSYITHTVVYKYCGEFIHLGVTRVIYLKTSDSTTKYELKVFVYSTLHGTSTYTISNFNLLPVAADEYSTQSSLNITAMISDTSGVFFILFKNPTTNATTLSMFSFDPISTNAFAPAHLATINVDLSKGQFATNMVMGLKTKTVMIYNSTSNNIYIFKYDATAMTLTFDKYITLDANCKLSKIQYNYANFYDRIDTAITHDEFVSSCYTGTNFSIYTWRMSYPLLNYSIKSKLENVANSATIATARVENGYFIGYYANVSTTDSKSYHLLRVIDVSNDTPVSILNETVPSTYTDGDYEYGDTLYGYYVNSELSFFGLKYRYYTTESPTVRVLVSSYYTLHGPSVCFRDDCLLCLGNSAGSCSACKKLTYLYNGNCYKTSDMQPEGTYLIGSRYFDCDVANCADCLSDKTVCTTCKYSAFEKFYKLASENKCYSTFEASSLVGKGINEASKSILACDQAECNNCALNNEYCTKCIVASTLPFLYPVTGECVALGAFPAGYGRETATTYLLRPCAIGASCKHCEADFNECTECISGMTLMFVNARTPKMGCTNDTTLNVTLGYGLDTSKTPNVFEVCAITDCLLCRADYTGCTGCKITHQYLGTISSALHCLNKNELQLLTHYGIINSTTFGACKDTRCGDCLENNQVCVACDYIAGVDPTLYLFKAATDPTKMCLLKAEIANRFGIDDIYVRACDDPNCKKCVNQFDSCTECDASWYLYTNALLNKVCVDPSNPPPGYAYDIVQDKLVPCATPNCLKCTADYRVCTECNTTYFLLNEPLRSVCWDMNSIEPGYGRVYPTYTLDMCVANNCTNCFLDNYNCSVCNNSVGTPPYLRLYLQPIQPPQFSTYVPLHVPVNPLDQPFDILTCVNFNDILSGYGFPTSNPTPGTTVLQKCDDPNCADCRYLKSDCDECSSPYYKDYSQTVTVGTVGCILESAILAGTGKYPGYFEVYTCADSQNCKNCKENIFECTHCLTTAPYKYLFPVYKQCLDSTFIIPEYGMNDEDTTNYVLSPCSETDCFLCSDNYKMCTECTWASSKYLFKHAGNNGVCKDYSAIPALQDGSSNYFGIDVTAAKRVLVPCPSHCLSCQDNAAICDTCSSLYYPFKGGCKLKTDTSGTAGYGLDDSTTPTKYLKCDDANCLTCQPYFLNCQSCANGFAIIRHLSGLASCIMNGQSEDTYGPNMTTNPIEIYPCEDLGCLKCSLDNTKCTECKANNFWYVSSDGVQGICVQRNAFPYGFGIDTSKVKSLGKCTIPMCNGCFDDITVCDSCFSPMFLVKERTHCVEVSAIPNGQGIQSASAILAQCLDLKCTKCVGNSLVCDVCAEGYRTTLAGVCEPCTVTGCASCPTAASQCSLCTSAFGFYYLDANSNRACIANIAAIPTGLGIVAGTPEVRACSAGTSNCKTCDVNDHTKCTACNNLYFLLHSSKACITAAVIPVGHGKDLTNPSIPMVKQCSVARCMICTEDYQTCNNCSSTGSDALYKLTVGPTVTCVYSSELTDNQGPDILSFAVRTCEVAYCSVCNLNSKICQGCQTNYRLFVQSGSSAICLSSSATPDPGFGYDTTNTSIIRACSSTRCLLCKDNFQVCTECRDEYYLYPTDATASLPGTCAAFSDIAAGYAVSTTLPKKLEACGVKCQTCSTSNPSVCLACKPNYFFYKKIPAATTVECLSVLFTDITPIDGFGKKGADLELQPCSEGTLCISCWNNYQTCTSCLSTNPIGGATMYYYAAGATKCIGQGSIPAGSGPSTRVGGSDPMVAVGIQTCGAGVNCKTCNVNYGTCTECQTNYFLHTDGTCLGVSDMGDFKGGVVTSNPKHTGPCTLEGCRICSSDNTKCTVCGTGMYQVMSADGLTAVKCFPNDLLSFEYNSNLYGLKGSAGTTVTVCPTGCLSCMTSTCDVCDPSLSLYLGACIADANIPSKMGKSVENGVIVIRSCFDSLCDSCKTDIYLCTSCSLTDGASNNVFEHRVQGNNKVCYTASQLPLGWGADASTKKAFPCTVPSCENCNLDFTKCTACVSNAFVYPRGTNDLVCYASSTTEVPIAYGRDSPSQVLKACTVPNCQHCFDDYSVCSICSPGYLYREDQNLCIQSSTVIPGYGPDYSDPFVPKLSECKIPDCALCQNSATVSCTQCKTNMFLEEGTSVSVPKCYAALPVGYGPVSQGSLTITTCTVTGCITCSDVKTQCTACLAGMLLENNACNIIAATEGRGYDIATNSYKTCDDLNCLECRRDYKFCARCNLDAVLDSASGKCYKIGQWDTFPDLKGVDGFNLETCTVSNCKRCPSGVATCDECIANYSLNALSSASYCEPDINAIDIAQLRTINSGRVTDDQFDRSSQASLVTFQNLLPETDYMKTLMFMPFKADGSRVKSVTLKSAKLVGNKKQMVFEFESAEKLDGIIALLKSKYSSTVTSTSGNQRLLATSVNPFDSGILLQGLNLKPVKSGSDIEILSIVVTVLLSVLSLAAFKHSQYYGFKMLYYHTLLGSLTYFTAQKPIYMKSLLKHLDWTLASFVPLPKTSEETLKCVPTVVWYFSDISCFVYNNLNMYVVLLGALIIIKIGLNIMSKNKSFSDKPLVKRLRTYSSSSFVMKYFSAISPAWVFAALTNIYYGAPSATMGGGMFLSILIIILYFGWLCLSLRNQLLIKKGQTEGVFALTATITRLRVESPVALLAHNVDLLKTILFIMFVVFAQRDPTGQSIAGIVIFTLSLIYLITVRPYSLKSDNMFVILIELMFVVLFIISAVSAGQVGTMEPDAFESNLSTAYFIFFFAVVVLMITWFIKLFFKQKENKDYNQVHSATNGATVKTGADSPENLKNYQKKTNKIEIAGPEIDSQNMRLADSSLPPISNRRSSQQAYEDAVPYMRGAHADEAKLVREEIAQKGKPDASEGIIKRASLNQIRPLSSSSKGSRASHARNLAAYEREPVPLQPEGTGKIKEENNEDGVHNSPDPLMGGWTRQVDN